MMQKMVTLNNGITMPLLGLGVYNMNGKEAERAVGQALDIGYRLIDTAAAYHNETEIGNAIRDSNIPRQEIFLTTKVDNNDQGYDKTLQAFDISSKKLNADYIDLYLVHWPIKSTRRETWQALERLYQEKRVRAIGVANYLVPFLNELKTYAEIVPAVNQVEFSPYLFLEDLLNVCKERTILLQAYSPIVRGEKLDDPKLIKIAQQYNKTPAQIILRWAIQLGVSTIPKSSNFNRLQENFNIWDFEISPYDMEQLNHFNENYRVVEDPMEML